MMRIIALAEETKIKYPILVVLFTQIIVLFLLRNILYIFHLKLSPWHFIFSQVFITGFIINRIFRLPKWLLVISSLFPPSIYIAFVFWGGGTLFFGVLFIILALTFSHTISERVPLYLSNTTTTEALRNFAKKKKCKKFLDLGSGTGRVVRSMAFQKVSSYGTESAPVLWFFSNLLSILSRKGKIHRRNIWKVDLGEYDLVYAFLSPAIMEDLWKKIQKEMKPGSFFISNSFIVPNFTPDQTILLSDGRRTRLYIYHIKS